jgi:cell fate regulator YaaT (PSP1 superfamily)
VFTLARVVGAATERYGRVHYLDAGELDLRVGEKVVVEAGGQEEVMEVLWPPTEVGGVQDLPRVLRKASEADVLRSQMAQARRESAKERASALARKRGVPIKVVGADYDPSQDRYTIYFSAAEKVDFRAYHKELAGLLGGKVEFRQVGARDEARLVGGIGLCGRELCCSLFLDSFDAITVRMAKEQGLDLNPLRISGACGRLLCCLRYEHPLYEEFRRAAPPLGAEVEIPQGRGVVIEHRVPREEVVVALAEGKRVACPLRASCPRIVGAPEGKQAPGGTSGAGGSAGRSRSPRR